MGKYVTSTSRFQAPGSRFQVPGSTFVCRVQVLGSRFGVPCSGSEPRTRNLELGTSNSEPRTRNANHEQEPGTWNVEPGTAGERSCSTASCLAVVPDVQDQTMCSPDGADASTPSRWDPAATVDHSRTEKSRRPRLQARRTAGRTRRAALFYCTGPSLSLDDSLAAPAPNHVGIETELGEDLVGVLTGIGNASHPRRDIVEPERRHERA